MSKQKKFITNRWMMGCLALLLLLGACDKPEEKEAKFIQSGNAYLAKGDFTRAQIEYKNAAEMRPMDPEPFYRLALSSEAQGDMLNAYGNLTAALQQDAHYMPALKKIVVYFLAADMKAEAAERLNILETIDPQDADTLALRASLDLKNGNDSAAEAKAKESIARDGKQVMAWSVLSNLYMKQSRSDAARAALDEALQRAPNAQPLLRLNAIYYEEKGDIDKVAETYGKLFAADPANLAYRQQMAEIFQNAGRLDDAERVLREGLSPLSTNVQQQKILAAFLEKARGIDAAAQEIKAWIKADPDDKTYLFWLADLYVRNNAIDRAIALLQDVVKADRLEGTANLHARAALARLNLKEGDRVLAEKLISGVLDKDPHNADALFTRAQMSFDRGSYASAVSDLRLLLQYTPHEPHALRVLAEALLQEGRVNQAIDALTEVVARAPADIESQVRLAQLYGMNGDVPRAYALLDRLQKATPDSALVIECVARIALDNKDWPRAKDAIDALKKQDESKDLAAFLEGEMFRVQGKPAEALPFYLAIIQKNKASPLMDYALNAYADTAIRLGQVEKVESVLEKLTAKSPLSETLRGRCLVYMRKIDAAKAAFDAVIAQTPPIQDPYLERAVLDRNERKFDESIALLKRAETVDPADMRAYLLIAETEAQRGHYQDAIDSYEGLLKKDPSQVVAANNMAQLIADYFPEDKDAMNKALKAVERFAASDNPQLLDTLGWVYFRQGKIDEAQVIMDKILQASKNMSPQVRYHHAALLLKAGHRDEAKAELQEATAPDASYSGLDEAKKLLQAL